MLATWALLTVLAVVAVELLRRHHRAIGRHAVRYGKRGALAAASARPPARRDRRYRWLVAKAAPRWENREHRPLMFRRLRGEPEDPEPQEEGSEGRRGSGRGRRPDLLMGPCGQPVRLAGG